jgi:hypothetical protein
MKKLFSDSKHEEARSCTSPMKFECLVAVKNITSCNQAPDYGFKKYVVF